MTIHNSELEQYFLPARSLHITRKAMDMKQMATHNYLKKGIGRRQPQSILGSADCSLGAAPKDCWARGPGKVGLALRERERRKFKENSYFLEA